MSYKGSLRDEVKHIYKYAHKVKGKTKKSRKMRPLREIFSRDAGLPVVDQGAHGEEEHQPEQRGPAHVLEYSHDEQHHNTGPHHLQVGSLDG